MDEQSSEVQEKTENNTSTRKKGFLDKIAHNPLEEAVVCICLALLTVILFVLLGGARKIYAVVQEKYPGTRNYSDFEVEVIPVPERTHDEFFGELNRVENGDDLRNEMFAHLIHAGKDSEKNQMQGACTNGEWIWAGWSAPFRMMKVHTLTHETLIKEYTEEEWRFGHINDMTYNPNTGKLYIISYNTGDRNTYGDVSVVDAETLEYQETIKLTNKQGNMIMVGGITYDRVHDEYIMSRRGGAGSVYYVFDSQFNYLRRFTLERVESYTLQGIETDGTYLYRALYYEEANRGAVMVYDLKGNFVKLLYMPALEGIIEIEDIMYDWNGNWYANAAVWEDELHHESGHMIYYVGLYSEVDYSQMERLLNVLEKEFALKRKVSHPIPADILY